MTSGLFDPSFHDDQAMLAANVCMWVGLVLITSIDVGTLFQHGAEPVLLYNPDTFVLFLGAVVVCFEGIGLVLPLRDSMEPHMQVSARSNRLT